MAARKSADRSRPARQARRPARDAERGFADELLSLLIADGAVRPAGAHQPLVDVPYPEELALKREALARHWRRHDLRGDVENLLPSPRPRAYRTTSKRRVAWRNGVATLFLGDRAPRSAASPIASPLEPPEHGELYEILRSTLQENAFHPLAAHLGFLIVRGSYAQRCLILNVDTLNGALVRKMKALAEIVRPRVDALFAYLDPSRSDYHFESRRPDEAVTFKRLFGPEQLTVHFAGRRYQFHPTSFSQVNESIVPTLLARASELLAPRREELLLDLFCGYGLFSHFLARDCKQVLGVDVAGPSIRSAVANTALNPAPAPRRFLAARITADFVQRALPRAGGAEIQLLDPPRNGPPSGVIAALARRSPRRVLHVFCDVDQIAPCLTQWRRAGYHPRRAVPLDMFPGTANLEVLVLLEPA